MTSGGRVQIQDCCLTARGQWLGPALANPRGTCVCVPVSSKRGVVAWVLPSRPGPEHHTMARGNYASCRMGNGGGRDIWTLTSNLGVWSHTMPQPDWRGPVVRQEGSAHIDQDRGWKCKCTIQLPTELIGNTHLSMNPSVTLGCLTVKITGLNGGNALTWSNIHHHITSN